ncbi:helix-turn-helix transcriptional regulator [Leucobacter sp. CSA2]|uniref:Helix-turn-helix transcriptional regulator n=1 Tax=Leucobacter edaphi TaxID=2796472 RepID=A0A934QBW0_9MICO|nr:TetR/AcrR family transcriptional regulator [Leucobacter edaphi]MBK0421815.1 helix-turn-helix transcriptional regulator [Leucobacter edaphi]
MNETTTPRHGAALVGKKVGRKPVFTAAEVVEAACAEGIDRFTMAAVAKRLGVVPAAIYRLFPSRDDLVLACIDAVGATVARPAPGTHWRSALQLWADEAWRLCEDFPGFERVLFSTPTAAVRVEPVFRDYAEHLGAQGIGLRQVTFALDFIGDTVFASHLGVAAMRATRDDGRTGLEAARDSTTDADALLRPEDSWATRAILDVKIDFILEGLHSNWPEF